MSQPELSSGGGSSLSSGKLSKLLVSVGEVTWVTDIKETKYLVVSTETPNQSINEVILKHQSYYKEITGV